MFKNLLVFRLPHPIPLSTEEFSEQLSKFAFIPPTSQEMSRSGWTLPRPREHQDWVHKVGGQWLISLCTEKKLLPTSVIQALLQERIEALEEKETRKIGKKESKELQVLLTEELMPRAFSTKQNTLVWIDPKEGLLVINASAPSKADSVIELLLQSLVGIQMVPIKTTETPVACMTEWLMSGESPQNFTLDRDCEVKSSLEDKPSVRYSNLSLDREEIQQHITEGKLPIRLAMTWKDRLSFVLTETGAIKNLEFIEVATEMSVEKEHESDQFDTDFALMTGEISALLHDLWASLGGEISLVKS